jgi:hypothetical protein
MEKISWTDRVRNGVLQRIKEERSIVQTIKGMKTKWNGRVLRRNCLLKHVIEGKIEENTEETRRRRIRRKQPLDFLEENRR